MRRSLTLLGLLAAAVFVQGADDYGKFTSVGEIGLTITNFGVIGHGYNIQGQPSCLYKQYSSLDFEQVEHFSYGGLWIGGLVDGEARVSTAVMDGTFGGEGWEWNNTTSIADTVHIRSSLPTSQYFSGDAVSHQDFLISFTDTSRAVPATGEEITNHTPLGLKVDLASHAWNYSFADAFVILDMTITNISQELDPAGTGWTIQSLRSGFWIDEAVGNFNLNNYYEPGRGGWSWYDNLAGVVLTDEPSPAAGDSIWMAVGYDADGDNGYSQSILGCRFIGGSAPHVSPLDIRPGATAWEWNNSFNPDWPLNTPENDEERYAALAERAQLSDALFPYTGANTGSWMMLASASGFGDLEPGESCNAVFAIACGARDFIPDPVGSDDPFSGLKNLQVMAQPLVANTTWARIAWDGEDKNRDGVLQPEEDLDADGELDRYLLPNPPPGPRVKVVPGEREALVYWRNDPEQFVDPILGEADFEGYRVYSSLRTPGAEGTRTLLGQFDLVNGIWPNTGLEDLGVRHALGVDADSVLVDGIWYHYAFHVDNLPSGRPEGLWLAVSSYDHGLPENNLPSLESDVKENWSYLFPGGLADTRTDGKDLKPGVYPNPYRGRASWDGAGAYERVLWFTHLPERCTVSIFTLSGDFVDSFEHDAATYQGEDVAGIADLMERINGGDGRDAPFIFSGGEHAWDLVSKHDQAIASGLYLFVVEDKATGKTETGKFAVIK